MTSTADNFARNLRAIIEATGQSQRQFAAKAGTSHVYVNRVLQGKIKPTLTMAEKLAGAAGLKVVDLLGAPRKSKIDVDTTGGRL